MLLLVLVQVLVLVKSSRCSLACVVGVGGDGGCLCVIGAGNVV